MDHPIIELGDEAAPTLIAPIDAEMLRQQREDALERNFNAVRPWAGNMMPPSAFDPATTDFGMPGFELVMDHVYGFRSRGARDNVHWVDAPHTILYFAASVACVYNWVERTHKFFTGHEDDIACVAYCPATRLAATGGLGKRTTAPIKIWNVDTLKVVQDLSGTLEFNVAAVAFSADGSRVIGVGSDNVCSIALYDVKSGALLAKSSGDSNRILHIISNTCDGSDSRKQYISIGISHVKFWTKDKETFIGKKAIGGNIAKQTAVSVACTTRYVLVGNVSGEMYVFSQGTLAKTIKVHGDFCGAIAVEADVVYTGGRDGKLKKWSLEPEAISMVELQTVDLNKHTVLSSKSAMRKLGNGPRALSVKDGQMIMGTCLGCIHAVTGPAFDVHTVLDTHFEDKPGSLPELWGLAIHPTDPLFATAAEDSTLRLWSVELGSLVLLADVVYPALSCAFSADGTVICVGHKNGAFSVWDAMTLTPVHPFTRKREFEARCCAYSPDGRFLAIGMGLSHVIDVYDCKRNYAFIASCDAVSGNVRQLDWSLRSAMLRCSTTSYEVVHFNLPSCVMNQSLEIADEVWASQSCVIGWGVQGIWEGCSDGTDVNCVGISKCGTLLAAGYDSCKVRLYNYPCLPRQSDRSSKLKYPDHREYGGHSSHVTTCGFTADNRYLLSAGGMDLSIIRWRVVPVNGPRRSHEPLKDDAPEDDPQHLGPTQVADAVAKGKIFDLPQEPRATAAEAMSLSMRREKLFGASASQKATMRRPGSGNDQVRSRLFETTASMQEKTRHGLAQKTNVERQVDARKRFSAFV